MKYTIDYTQDEQGRWSARIRGGGNCDGTCRLAGGCQPHAGEHTPPRLTVEDCVGDVYDAIGDDVELEVGTVTEWPGLGL